jgi:hypothetical protein
MVKIEQVIVPTKQAGEYLNIVALNFPMNPDQVEFYWQLLTDDTSGICVLDGKLLMNKQTYDGWNSDDSYVVNWACNLLGFKLV